MAILNTLLSKFNRCHTHADDEVRYIIDGEGVFGFVRPDGSQVELTITSKSLPKY
jgi:1,2-dihydroxy-3-keto-5-methylthiopentene dioxygenase